MKNNLIVACCLLILIFSITAFLAVGGEGLPDITIKYQRLSTLYEDYLIKGEYVKAFQCAKEQLDIDPSDTVAYLRLAVAAQYVDAEKEILKRQYAPFVSEEDDLHKEIKSLANSILAGKKSSKLNKEKLK